jgi:MbtH protein
MQIMVESSRKTGEDLGIDGESFVVLINAELQYSLWPSGRAMPEGWSCAHSAASKAECLAYVEANWTDLRPLSVR